MKDDVVFVIKTDRGYIQYSEYYQEIRETQYGVVSDIKYAKRYSRQTANVIVRKFKKKGKYAEKIEVEDEL